MGKSKETQTYFENFESKKFWQMINIFYNDMEHYFGLCMMYNEIPLGLVYLLLLSRGLGSWMGDVPTTILK